MLAGCASSGIPTNGTTPGASTPAVPSQPKRIVAAVLSTPPALSQKLVASSAIRGGNEIEALANAGLTVADQQGHLHAQLADAVPTIENGLWQILPEGRMLTTWKIHAGAAWHDGVPFTAEDLVFSATVDQDAALPIQPNPAYRSIESITAPDADTLVITWNAPYINADSLFGSFVPGSSSGSSLPIPKHLLERPFTSDKSSFADLPYWSTEFIGTGPFKVSEWVQGEHLLLDANDQYVLGRPKIDQIDVRFIPDQNTLLSNVLADSVDLSLGKSVSFEQAQAARGQWQDGRVDIAPANPLIIFPQMQQAYENPAVVGDVRFRRALYSSIDRQQIVETLLGGLSTVADGAVLPSDPYYEAVKPSIVQYPYDPGRAAQNLQVLGYTRGPEGQLRDGAGQPLSLEFRTVDVDIDTKTLFIVTQMWEQLGISVTPYVMPPQQAQDLQYHYTFPAFEVLRNPPIFTNYVSAQVKRPENGWRGSQEGGFSNVQYDDIVDRYLRTIPTDQRYELAAEAIHLISDQLAVMPLFYDVDPNLITNRLHGVAGAVGNTWNAADWDVTS